jgi:hypothetical protein
MDAQDLVGKRVTITEVDLEAWPSNSVAHLAIVVDDGPALVFEARLDPARAKAMLTLRDATA